MEVTGNRGIEFPFLEERVGENFFIRRFFNNTDCGDFHWHRDREDRIIVSTNTTDWKIQLEDELPRTLNEKCHIPMGVWHRVIKGSGDLEIKLIKLIT